MCSDPRHGAERQDDHHHKAAKLPLLAILPNHEGNTTSYHYEDGRVATIGLSYSLLRGSWVVISGAISRVTIVITQIRRLITPLITTHEPPSSFVKRGSHGTRPVRSGFTSDVGALIIYNRVLAPIML